MARDRLVMHNSYLGEKHTCLERSERAHFRLHYVSGRLQYHCISCITSCFSLFLVWISRSAMRNPALTPEPRPSCDKAATRGAKVFSISNPISTRLFYKRLILGLGLGSISNDKRDENDCAWWGGYDLLFLERLVTTHQKLVFVNHVKNLEGTRDNVDKQL